MIFTFAVVTLADATLSVSGAWDADSSTALDSSDPEIRRTETVNRIIQLNSVEVSFFI